MPIGRRGGFPSKFFRKIFDYWHYSSVASCYLNQGCSRIMDVTLTSTRTQCFDRQRRVTIVRHGRALAVIVLSESGSSATARVCLPISIAAISASDFRLSRKFRKHSDNRPLAPCRYHLKISSHPQIHALYAIFVVATHSYLTKATAKKHHQTHSKLCCSAHIAA